MKAEILRSLTATPHVMERLLRVFPSDRLDDKLGGVDFTPREAIASLADNEVIILDRIRMAHKRPGTAVESIDPVAQAKTHNYTGKNVFHEAEVYESRRLMTVDYLGAFEPGDWEKTLVLSGAEVTLNEYISLVLANDLFHLDQISRHMATEVATLA